MKRLRWIALGSALLVSAASCGGGGNGGGGTSVGVTLKDFSIVADPSSVDAGTVSFDITNDGPSTHELAIVRTDLAPGALPVESGEVPESEIDIEDEQEDIAPSTSTTLSVDLPAGSYVLVCNLPGHYQQGMYAAFTVR